jgi:hypothetical protein
MGQNIEERLEIKSNENEINSNGITSQQRHIDIG